MKLLIVGSGAREHALAWKIAQSPEVTELYAAPGNAGIASLAHNLKLHPTDTESLGKAAQDTGVDLAVIGPEAPLASGIVDYFQHLGVPVFGPTQAATRIESSKVFAKKLMQKYAIPCPKGVTFSTYADARDYVDSQRAPIVIKADGLAGGKGVIVAESKEEALRTLSATMEARVFGSAGDSVVIEECLTGKEVSFLAFTDSKTAIPMVPACDYKRVFDDDRGPNTGGMGSYSPPAFFDADLAKQVMETILEPAIRAMAEEKMPYTGVLYAGLMLTSDGPKVLEFNARFGDPETQVILPRLKTDLVHMLLAVVNSELDGTAIEWSNDACVGVVMASGGYPGDYETGFPIRGLDRLDEETLVFHAGTRRGEGSQIHTDGGRVITVATTGRTMAEARDRVYRELPNIHFDGCHYRKDIAAQEVN